MRSTGRPNSRSRLCRRLRIDVTSAPIGDQADPVSRKARPMIRARCSTSARRQCRRTQGPCQQTPFCGDDGAASVRRQFPTMGEHDHEVRLSALWSERLPTAGWSQWPAGGRMLELRKGLDVRSVDVVRTVRAVGNTEVARCGEVGGPCGCDDPHACHWRQRTAEKGRATGDASLEPNVTSIPEIPSSAL
jgi:hypothetical protein